MGFLIRVAGTIHDLAHIAAIAICLAFVICAIAGVYGIELKEFMLQYCKVKQFLEEGLRSPSLRRTISRLLGTSTEDVDEFIALISDVHRD